MKQLFIGCNYVTQTNNFYQAPIVRKLWHKLKFHARSRSIRLTEGWVQSNIMQRAERACTANCLNFNCAAAQDVLTVVLIARRAHFTLCLNYLPLRQIQTPSYDIIPLRTGGCDRDGREINFH